MDQGKQTDGGRGPVWAAFEMPHLLARREESAQPWLPFLEAPTLTAGLYVLPEEGVDNQEPHEQDELYYVLSGRAKIEVEGERRPVGHGSVIYVRAYARHRFFDIEEELKVLVLFSAAEPAAGPASFEVPVDDA